MNPALITGAAGLLGGALENFGNARQARLNRQFQERMANTAVQRRVKDLEAAGLNPAMAYEQQAQTPGGAQATMTDPIGKGVSNAMQARQLQANLELTKAQTDKAAAEAESANVDAGIKSGRLVVPEGSPSYLDEVLARRGASIAESKWGPEKLRQESLLVPSTRAKVDLEAMLLRNQGSRSELMSLLFGAPRDAVNWVDKSIRGSADGAASSARAWRSVMDSIFEKYRAGLTQRWR